MTNIKDTKNENFDNLEIDLDFSDGLSDDVSADFSDVIQDFEDIVDSKSLPFDDVTIDNNNVIDFTEDDIYVENIVHLTPPKEIEEFKIKDVAVGIEVKEEIIELVSVVDETTLGASDAHPLNLEVDSAITNIMDGDGEEDIIELVDRVEAGEILPLSKNLSSQDILPIPPPTKTSTTQSTKAQEIALSTPLIETTTSIPSLSISSNFPILAEEHIVAMIEKVIEDRYGKQLDLMFSKALDNILNRQLDDIKKKISTALQ